MSIIYNNKVVAGKYAQQVVADADTVNAGIIKIATEEQINEGTDNTTAVTPFYLAQKQDKISAGDNIVINNNEISCTIKPDEQTIVRKNNGTMQCIGQLTKSNTLKFDWEGTQAEYNVAYLNGTIQPDWYCYITDDEEFVDYGDIANQSLSNLKAEGEARFTAKANTDLSNLAEEGEARFTAKANTDLSNLTEEGLKLIKDNSGSGLEVCDIGMALYVDETKGLRRYLNGQIVDINANTQAFLDRLLQIQTTNPDYFTTENNWQSEALLNIDGCVYKFVLNYSGDNVVSVRLPKYPDYVEINAGGTLPVVGNGMTLGWTDGTVNLGSATGSTGNYHFQFMQGSYGVSVGSAPGAGAPSGAKTVGITSDPTKSGIQTTLKQTKLKMRYFIQIATGSETEVNIVNTLENVNGFTLLESKYADKPLYNECWLLSNGQYNPKGTYPTAYEGLQVEYNTEIEAGTTVTLPSGVSYTKRGLSVKLSTETYTDYDFVLNTADETFRLPLKTKLASGKAVAGNGMTLGLSDGTNFGSLRYNSNYGEIGVGSQGYGISIGTDISSFSGASFINKGIGITTDPTKSGIELSDSDLYLYFYVGDIDQNHGIVNMGRIGEQLANKTDMLQASGAGMPSDKYIDLNYVNGGEYTAPANGFFSLTMSVPNSATGGGCELYNQNTKLRNCGWNIWTRSASCFIPAKKGDVITAHQSESNSVINFRFTYAEGSK